MIHARFEKTGLNMERALVVLLGGVAGFAACSLILRKIDPLMHASYLRNFSALAGLVSAAIALKKLT